MDIAVTLIYYGIVAFLALTVFFLLYDKLKPLINTLLPKHSVNDKVDCPNCFKTLRKTKKGFECDNCGFIDEFLEEK